MMPDRGLPVQCAMAVRHAPPEEYAAFLQRHYAHPAARRRLHRAFVRFVDAYPNLQIWFAAPLPERVGRLYGAGPREYLNPASYGARQYLHFLASSHMRPPAWPASAPRPPPAASPLPRSCA